MYSRTDELIQNSADGQSRTTDLLELVGRITTQPEKQERYRTLRGVSRSLPILYGQGRVAFVDRVMDGIAQERPHRPAGSHRLADWWAWITVAAAACLVIARPGL